MKLNQQIPYLRKHGVCTPAAGQGSLCGRGYLQRGKRVRRGPAAGRRHQSGVTGLWPLTCHAGETRGAAREVPINNITVFS